MKRRLTAGILVLALGAASVVAVLAVRPSNPQDPGNKIPAHFGFSDNGVTQGVVTPQRDAKLLAAAGARIARVQFDWRFIEPSPGQYRLGVYDAIYRAYRARHIKLLLVFAYAPPWAAAHPCAAPCLVAPATKHVADAARTASYLARRYPGLAGVEIWNEPNTPYFWGGPPDAAAYTRLLRACSLAIKRVRPRMRVIGGAIANATSSGSVPLETFLSAMLHEHAERWMDAVSIHPYPAPGDLGGETADRSLDAARAALAAGGAETFPIWLTELGISTTGPNAVTESQQGTTLVSLVQRLQMESNVRVVLLHTLVEPPKGPADRETGFGVVRTNLRPKPAYCALEAALGDGARCSTPGTITP